jgi:UDP-N-acetylmuramoyl-tripeptide--D-alanyl-D-alanine ligase
MATPIPKNRAPFTPEQIALATEGILVRVGPSCVGVSTDSRTAEPGVAFIALTGGVHDGHDHVAEAVGKGAAVVVVSRDLPASTTGGAAVVRVVSTRVALGRLARAHRLRWSDRPHAAGARTLAAITGSAGKTTTKNVAHALLDAVAGGEVHVAQGNLNNDVGVPMTLFGLEPHHRFAVVEVGTSGRGEIRNLASIAAPDVGVLTLVASAHTQGIGSIDDVAQEKGDLLVALRPEGVAIANADDARASAQSARSRARRSFTYGFAGGASYRIASRRSLGAAGAHILVDRPGGRIMLTVPLLGESGVLASAAGLCIAESMLGRLLSSEEANAGLALLGGGVEGRLKPIFLQDGTLVIDDTYNANPASMRASIAAAAELAQQEKRRLVLVLGEMRELGDTSTSEHEALGKVALGAAPAVVLGVSGAARSVIDVVRRANVAAAFAPSSDVAAGLALDVVRPGDVVLVKGSRGVATEKVVAALVGRAAPMERTAL